MTVTALAFDYGLKSIGVAYGQALTGSGKELPLLSARDGIPDWGKIEQLLQEWKPKRLIVGLPLNMDGSESELCIRVRKFGRRLYGRFSIDVEYMDERLSTFDAKQEAKERRHKGDYRSNPIDSIAARIILESWFIQQNSKV
ncbi:Holliday junction DNA helicase RuvA [Candidatus Endobugula sertula]|uniref:Putative pre-16S rRNA nuclease n=1 Tax=Candidatus Endobugula sertula TaxID=62101 RepID=A0A1D2QSJ8_9GAMM|nr:Holliday junction DNA helicase RuvA [Candidatus Endobugula sertula]